MLFFIIYFLYNEFSIECFNDPLTTPSRLLLIKFLPKLFLVMFNVKTIYIQYVIIADFLKMLVLVLLKLIFRVAVCRVKLTIWVLWVLKVKVGGACHVDECFVGIVQSSFVKFVIVRG